MTRQRVVLREQTTGKGPTIKRVTLGEIGANRCSLKKMKNVRGRSNPAPVRGILVAGSGLHSNLEDSLAQAYLRTAAQPLCKAIANAVSRFTDEDVIQNVRPSRPWVYCCFSAECPVLDHRQAMRSGNAFMEKTPVVGDICHQQEVPPPKPSLAMLSS